MKYGEFLWIDENKNCEYFNFYTRLEFFPGETEIINFCKVDVGQSAYNYELTVCALLKTIFNDSEIRQAVEDIKHMYLFEDSIPSVNLPASPTKEAIKNSGKKVPYCDITISLQGEVQE